MTSTAGSLASVLVLAAARAIAAIVKRSQFDGSATNATRTVDLREMCSRAEHQSTPVLRQAAGCSDGLADHNRLLRHRARAQTMLNVAPTTSLIMIPPLTPLLFCGGSLLPHIFDWTTANRRCIRARSVRRNTFTRK